MKKYRICFCKYWPLLTVLLVLLIPAPSSLANSPPTAAPRQTRELVKKIDVAFKEAQSRRGGALEARLTEMWQAVVLSDPDIDKYARENPRRHGAAIYVSANGESGVKSVTLMFYRPEEIQPLEGKIGSKIKEWFFPQPIAQNLAKKTLSALLTAPSSSFRAQALPPEQGVGIVLIPSSGAPLSTASLGESLFQK